jgi:hypothetical protein
MSMGYRPSGALLITRRNGPAIRFDPIRKAFCCSDQDHFGYLAQYDRDNLRSVDSATTVRACIYRSIAA